MAAGALVPEVDLLVTGRLEDMPEGLARSASGNVSFVGFLPPEQYRDLVASADVVIGLTTEPTSVMRCAYEAVYARKPLLVSDWALCRELFPFAVPVSNDAQSIATGLKRARRAHRARCSRGRGPFLADRPLGRPARRPSHRLGSASARK